MVILEPHTSGLAWHTVELRVQEAKQKPRWVFQREKNPGSFFHKYWKAERAKRKLITAGGSHYPQGKRRERRVSCIDLRAHWRVSCRGGAPNAGGALHSAGGDNSEETLGQKDARTTQGMKPSR